MSTGQVPAAFARALVIDDSDGDALLAEMVLQEISPGLTVRHIDNGADALALLTDSKSPSAAETSTPDGFDLVLLDLSMPGITGFDVLDALAADRHFTTRVVVLTSSTRSADRDRVADYRVAGSPLDYIVKDTDFDVFRRLLTETLGGPRLG
jgi:CheY-like chemotaxis protein